MAVVRKVSRVIGVADMKRAVGFYTGALGLDVDRETPGWTDLTCGNGNLALQAYQPEEAKNAVTQTMVIFTVDDLESAIKDVEAAGGRLIRRHDNRHAPVIVGHVVDTEGNAVQLAQLKAGR